MNKNKFINFAITFLLVYLIVGFFTKGNTQQAVTNGDVTLTTTKNEYGQDETVIVKIKNNTNKIATIKNDCPGEPLNVFANNQGQWVQKNNTATIKCDDTADLVIKPGDESQVTYLSWNHALFANLGKYKISALVNLQPIAADPASGSQTTVDSVTQSSSQTTAESTQAVSQQSQTMGTGTTQQTQAAAANSQPTTKTFESNEFQINTQSWFNSLWTTIFYQPIYNTLIFITGNIPFHDLGFAIILLTIIIRTLLLIPSQKALKSQRHMQEIQPKINHIREKYKDNQEMIAKETMAIWKEHKVNPFGSCLPLLIQFPVLIGLYYVIQSGLNPNNTYLLYSFLKNISIADVNTNFLGIMDLTKINQFVLPLIVGGLQFMQMKLALMRNDNKKQKDDKAEKKPADSMQAASQMMVYFMPVMIALFTASTPAGVGLYWSTTTLYGIMQQLVVNKQVEAERSGVTVITKKAD